MPTDNKPAPPIKRNNTESRLFRFFMTSSLVALLVIAVLLGGLFRSLSVNALLKQHESENIHDARIFANQLWASDVDALILSTAGKSGAELRATPQLAALHQKVLKILKGTNIFKIKVYDLKGITIYSTELGQIGEDKSADQGVRDGLRGLGSSLLSHKNQFSTFEGEVQDRDLVESYVPGYNPVTGQLGGVFEIYADATALLADIDRQQRVVVSSVVGLLAVLYLALWVIAKRVETRMLQQYLERKRIQAALRESEQRWKFALEGSGAGVWDRNLESGEVVLSRRYLEIYGFDEEDLSRTRAWEDRIHPQDLPAVRADRAAYLAGHKPSYANERRMQCKDGSWKWILSRGMVVARDAQGKPLRMIGTHTDITERKQAEEKLLLAANVFKYAREGILITSAEAGIIDVNEAFTRITGYSRDEALGRNPRILRSGRQEPEFYAAMWRSLTEQGHWSGEVWNRRKNGEVYPEMLTISAVRDAAGQTQNYVALFTDITPMKQHQLQLEHIASFDALTDLPNRVLLADRLRRAMSQSQRNKRSVAVVFLDLDGFKEVNDQHGHGVGDALLIAISRRMKAALRDSDTLARIGGDEFVAVLAELERPHDCEPLLQRLLRSAADPIGVGALTVQVSASIGVAFYPQDGTDADLLMRLADQTMYAAKQSGKNRYLMFGAA